MIKFKTPRAEQNFRLASSTAHQTFSNRRKCDKCGTPRDMWDLKRLGTNTRFDPTRWVCKKGCDHEA